MYGSLPFRDQIKAFQRPPQGCRKIVVATNVAEASVTIPGIVYVVDCGFVKLRWYNPDTQTDALVVVPISQASCVQRAGRAGRMRPGKVYRCYTEEAFHTLPEYTPPEMQRTNLSPAILQLKALGIDNVLRFDFPSPPPARTLATCLQLLYALEAMDKSGHLTHPLGERMAELPLDPLLARLLCISGEFECSQEIAAIVAMLQIQNIFVYPRGAEAIRARMVRRRFEAREGDLLTYLNVFCGYAANEGAQRWCSQNYVNKRALQRAETFQKQLLSTIKKMGIPTKSCRGDAKAVLRCITAGMFPNTAYLHMSGEYRTVAADVVLHVHPHSVFYTEERPPWVIFGEVLHTTQLFMRDLVAIDPKWLEELAAIYDGVDHGKFMERLDTRIKTYDRDIERMCNVYYQGFIDAVRELLQVRSQAKKLHSEIVGIDTDLRKSLDQVEVKTQELTKAWKVQANIGASIDSLKGCLPVLNMYSKLQQQMQDKRYYPALKTLEQLEHVQLPRIAKYRFSQHMKDNIPKVRQSIKDASMGDLRDFLENIRKYSSKIGEVAMRHVAQQLQKEPKMSTSFFRSYDLGYEDLAESSQESEEDVSAQELVDFSPVYRCLHIHTVLDDKDAFEEYYRKQRKKQARLALQSPTNMHENIESYRQYFHGVVGFFVVEDRLMNTAGTLVSKTYLEEVWSMAVSKVISAIRTHSSYCTEPVLMLKIKNLVMLLCSALKSYGYSVNTMMELLQELRDHYHEVLMQRWVHVFREIFEEDNYHPMHVSTPVEYQNVVERFPFKDANLEASAFPKTFPFSSMVPRVYEEMGHFIEACLQFSQDLGLSHTEVDDMLRKSTNLLLTRTLSGCLSSLIKRPSLSLLQLIQISINTIYLENSSSHLEEFISKFTMLRRDTSHVARLQGRAMFRDVRSEAEQQIYEQMKRKIDEFLELSNYDWLLAEPSGQASSYLLDLMAFLKSTFEAFTNLPAHVAQTACLSSCQHIARTLIDMLMDDEIKQVSTGALHQVNLDVIQCEQFAASEPVPGFDDGALLLCFADLRQLLDLFMAWDWSTYFHDYGQDGSKYLRVSPHRAVTLLEKLREADKKTMFSVLKKSERDKKKLMETVLKQLRQLLQQSNA
nr:EOG090X01NK [Lepidurus arcticus]